MTDTVRRCIYTSIPLPPYTFHPFTVGNWELAFHRRKEYYLLEAIEPTTSDSLLATRYSLLVTRYWE